MCSIFICNAFAFNLENISPNITIKNYIADVLKIDESDFYILRNGKLYTDSILPSTKFTLNIVPRVFGGKGGFGSMLRAIGAQIEKTTNREACRDLSGRRLRDINEEKRLKTWMAQQVEREKEAEDRRQKKLERLVRKPKHEFKDEVYEKERSDLPEKVEDALEQGLKASTSGNKRKIEDKSKSNKKPKLWLGSEDELSSSSEIDSENEDKDENKKDSVVEIKNDPASEDSNNSTNEVQNNSIKKPQSSKEETVAAGNN